MTPELTRQDFDTLLAAVEKWEQEDAAVEIMETMMDGMLKDNVPSAHEAFRLRVAEQQRKRKQSACARKERGVMLRAKLLQMRDGLDADKFIDDAQKGLSK
jgi:hypothetical protein